ncbi:MAG: hypothetical protein H7Z13_02635 [Ferruginibacter sp.]|nr:hypothetical protein [Ferruginibacter sp.]
MEKRIWQQLSLLIKYTYRVKNYCRAAKVIPKRVLIIPLVLLLTLYNDYAQGIHR